jgi:hypothetical protein
VGYAARPRQSSKTHNPGTRGHWTAQWTLCNPRRLIYLHIRRFSFHHRQSLQRHVGNRHRSGLYLKLYYVVEIIFIYIYIYQNCFYAFLLLILSTVYSYILFSQHGVSSGPVFIPLYRWGEGLSHRHLHRGRQNYDSGRTARF